MTEQAKVPAIRFAGFTDPWEQRKLGEIVDQYKKLVPTPRNGYIRMGVRSHAKGTFLTHVEPGAQIEENELSTVGPNNLVVNIVFAWEHAVAITSDSDSRALVSHRFPQFSFHDDMVPRFFKFIILDERFRHHLWLASPSGAGRNKTLNIKTMLEYKFVVPDKDEQRAIGSFFSRLDDLITLHQRKYDKLVVFKKSMLEKMFPKDGESVPEIRFAGFTDPWEQRKLSELLLERDEQAPQSDQYPLMAFIANQGIAPKGDRYDRSALVNDIEGKLYKRTEKGDFIYSSNNLETGSIGLNKYGNACISPVYSIFQPSGIADSDFLGRRLVRKDFIQEMVKWRQGVIYGQWRIHEADFLRLNIAVPSVDEQRLIGKLLDNLDSLITLHQRKLELLQNIKKSLLDKMFV